MKHFPLENFSWIDDILPEEEHKGEKEHAEDTLAEQDCDEDVLSDQVFPINIIDIDNINVMETQADEPDDPDDPALL